MSKLEETILQAIDIIVDRAISGAGYDKTIQAVIVECVDQTIGKYRVKYQDGMFYAYSENTDVTYATGTSVYVLVPSNDMGNDKRILGTTKKLGINYIPVVEQEDIYDVIGKNCISSNQTFGLHSYQQGGEVIVLYDKSNQSQAKINVNKTDLNEYIKQATNVKCGIQVQTALDLEQQYRGNYGIIFSLDFADNATGDTVTRNYVLDVDKMTGNPYKFIDKTSQYVIFDIDGANFKEINYIAIFCNDFVHSKENPPVDIYISDLEFCAVSRLSSDDINNCYLSIITPQGIYFDSNAIESDVRRLEAQVRVKGSVVDYNSQKIDFYWFSQDISITPTSQLYNKYGGQGWKCLNNYNILQKTSENESDVIEWLPYGPVWQARKSDVIAKEVKYKCVAVYDENILYKEVTIKNLSSPYDITIVSDAGTVFYFDIGHPTLTALMNGSEQLSYTYVWAMTDNSGSFTTLPTTASLNNEYNTLKRRYDELRTAIQNETLPAVTNEAQLKSLADQLASYNDVMRVENNKIHHVQIKEITNFNTYQCAVYNQGVYLGMASIVLSNILQTEGQYSLVINEGTYVYKYNNAGVAPTSEAVEHPIKIKELSFTVYDNLGNPISDDVIRHSKIRWRVPITNTLLVMDDTLEPPTTKTDTDAIYEDRLSLIYNIAKRYVLGYERNNIELTVEYKNIILSAETNLVFAKEGEPGTNGTDYLCRIVPVKNLPTTGPWASVYPIAIEGADGARYWNCEPASATTQFKVQLWHNENNIFTGSSGGTSSEGKAVTSVVWDVPLNSYRERATVNKPWNTTKSDVTRLTVQRDTGNVTFSGYSDNANEPPVNILRCTLRYENREYIATLPIISVKLSNNNYTVRLKDYTGFRFAIYANGGNRPTYDKTSPFTLVTMQKIDNSNWEDVSEKTSVAYGVDYSWTFIGKPDDDMRLADNDRNVETTRSQKAVRALDDFRGESKSNAVVCVLSHSGEVARIHMPVHLYVDRYGNPNLNGWDGNSVVIDDKGGVILAPQIGAGHKESDNSFTGVVMGDVKESYGQLETGFFGYYQGERTIFLDAETGKSEFGKAGSSQIIIDPSSKTAKLYSGDFYQDGQEAGQGLLIDFSLPEIRYGNGLFSVNQFGALTSTSGHIGGWVINEHNLQTEDKRITLSDDGSITASSGDFKVDPDGTIHSKKGDIGGWTITAESLTSKREKVKLNSDGSIVASNGKFTVSADGVLTSKEGTIGGWTITEKTLESENKNIVLNSNGSFTTSSGNFEVDTRGNMTAKSGHIGGWEIKDDRLQTDDKSIVLKADGSISAGNGTFYVDKEGNLTSTSGRIGGWIINTNNLQGGSITLWAEGRITGPGWSIDADGLAHFQELDLKNGGEKRSKIDLGLLDTDDNRIILGDFIVKEENYGSSGQRRPAFYSMYVEKTRYSEGNFDNANSGLSAWLPNDENAWFWVGSHGAGNQFDKYDFVITGKTTHTKALRITGPAEIEFVNDLSINGAGKKKLTEVLQAITTKFTEIDSSIKNINQSITNIENEISSLS